MELLWWVFLVETTSSNTLKACVATKPAPWARPAAATYRGHAPLLPGTLSSSPGSACPNRPCYCWEAQGGMKLAEISEHPAAKRCHRPTHKPSACHAVPLALGPGLGAGASSQAGRRGPLSSKWWAQSPPAPLPVTLHVLQAMLPESSHGAACEQHKRAERASFQPTVRHQTGLQKSFGSKDNSAGLRAR